MKKLRLLLLDANIVIELFELGLWDKVLEHCEVALSRTVASREASFYVKDGEQFGIDLAPYEKSAQIRVVEAELAMLRAFRQQFKPNYLERLDPGEAESLAFLCDSHEPWIICSSDSIVFRVLGLLRRDEQGISLEEILQRIGLGRRLGRQYSAQFREHWTRLGRQDRIQGFGLRE